MHRITLISVLFLFTFQAFGQKKALTLDDVTTGLGKFTPKTHSRGHQWIPGTNLISCTIPDGPDRAMAILTTEGDTVKIINTVNLNDALTRARIEGTIVKPDDPIRAFPASVQWRNSNSFRFKYLDFYLLFNTQYMGLVFENYQKPGAENVDIHPGSGNIAYTMGDNLFIRRPGIEDIQLSRHTERGMVSGKSVHRNEFGITKGTFWSPEGEKIAFYEMDEREVTDYPIYALDSMPAQMRLIKYPFAGKTSHQVRVLVYDIAKKTTRALQISGPRDQYLTNVTWSPDEKFIYIALLNREQNHMRLQRFNVETGVLDKELFEEKSDKYVEPENGPVFLPDGKRFIWQSERTGYNHLYLYNISGKLERVLTTGNWPVKELTGIDAKGKLAFFTAYKDDELAPGLYSVDLSNGKIANLSTRAGDRRVSMNSDGTFLMENYSGPDASELSVISADGKKRKVLETGTEPLKDYQLANEQLITLKTTGGVNLYGRIHTPSNLDSGKKYPVLVYVYGGPHAQMVSKGRLLGAQLWMHYLAQQGYIVFTLDNRGSSNRGLLFENATHRKLGDIEIEDQMRGIEYLRSLRFADTSRIGVFGWSFGGFMAASLTTRNPGVFKVSVAGGGVTDWAMYEIMYTERYMGTPDNNSEGYKNARIMNHIDKLQGRLLLIHGTDDDVVLWQHSLLLHREAIRKGKLVDYMPYPGHGHGVGGADRKHLYLTIFQYLDDHLK